MSAASENQDRDRGSLIQGNWPVALALLTLVSMHLPLFSLHLVQLWRLPHYQFFPILLAGGVYLIWRLGPPIRSDAGNPRLAIPWIVGGSLLQLFAAVLYSPWLSAVALLLTLAGVGFLLFRLPVLRRLLPIWLLLWMLIPFPFNGDKKVVQQLQRGTSRVAGATVDFLGIPHLMTGNLMELPGRQLFVDEACSGVNTVFAFAAFAGLFVCAAHRPWPIALGLITAAVGWAALMNFVRVVLIVVALQWWNVDMSAGFPHTLLSLLLLPATLFLLYGTERILMWLFGPIHRSGVDEFVIPPFARRWNRRLGWKEKPLDIADGCNVELEREDDAASPFRLPPIPKWVPATAVFSGLLFFVQLELMGATGLGLTSKPSSQFNASPIRFETLGAESLPENFAGWTRTDFETMVREARADFGEQSLIWRYDPAEHGRAAVSVDFPFTDFHDLTVCYRNIGWTMTSQQQVTAETPDGELPLVFAEFTKPTGEYGVVLFGLFYQDGHPVSPPAGLTASLSSRLGRVAERYRIRSKTYQLQIFMTAAEKVDKSDIEDLIDRFVAFRSVVTSAPVTQTDPGPEGG